MAIEQHMRGLGAGLVVLRDDTRQAGGLRQAGGKAHFLERIARPFGGAAAIGGMGRLGADAGDPQQAEQAFHRIFELVVDMLQNLFHGLIWVRFGEKINAA